MSELAAEAAVEPAEDGVVEVPGVEAAVVEAAVVEAAVVEPSVEAAGVDVTADGETDGVTDAETDGVTDGETDGVTDGETDGVTDGEAAPLRPKHAPLADPAELAAAVEAILFVVEAPVSAASIAAAIQQPEPAVAAAIETLRAAYDERGAGIEVRDVAGGVRIYTRPSVAAQVEVFLQDGQRSRLTQAALETLAVVAYRQPVTRSRVSAIRGVNVDGVVRTLTTRGLVVEAGTDPETGGGLLRTTELFLEKMGLTSLEELPSLAPLLPDVEGLAGLDGVDVDEL